MALRGRFIIAPALRKGEAMMYPRVQFEFTGNA
jgi:hypothetical protein